jgi:hypothetical protein
LLLPSRVYPNEPKEWRRNIILVRFKLYNKFMTRKFALKVEEIVDENLVEENVK